MPLSSSKNSPVEHLRHLESPLTHPGSRSSIVRGVSGSMAIEGAAMRRRDVLFGLLSAGAAGAGAVLAPRAALAQQKYPERPIRLVIPFPPGGVNDAIGRPWADRMKSLLGTV